MRFGFEPDNDCAATSFITRPSMGCRRRFGAACDCAPATRFEKTAMQSAPCWLGIRMFTSAPRLISHRASYGPVYFFVIGLMPKLRRKYESRASVRLVVARRALGYERRSGGVA